MESFLVNDVIQSKNIIENIFACRFLFYNKITHPGVKLHSNMCVKMKYEFLKGICTLTKPPWISYVQDVEHSN